jgi:CUB domain
VTSSSEKVLVQFKTDSSTVGRGWQFTYTSILVLTKNSGELKSHTTYPNDYFNFMDTKTIIRVTPGYRIYVNFTDFFIEPAWDYLTVHTFLYLYYDNFLKNLIALMYCFLKTQIYDGETIYSPVLLRSSGLSLPSAVTSSSNQVLVRFTTDVATALRGWHLTYTSV